MSKSSQEKNCTRSNIVVQSWDAAIADAKERIKRLKLSVKVFEQHRRAGEPWPGSESENASTQN
jgi:hypothetical protein